MPPAHAPASCILRLTRKPDGAVITLLRPDGSATSSRARDNGFFATHDLMHYAVETTLGYQHAFLGLLAQGHAIQEWEDSRSTLRTNPPSEAMHAELLVGLLHLKRHTEGLPALRACLDELNAHATAHAEPPNQHCPPLSASQLNTIADRYEQLLERWNQVPISDSLELPWPA